MIQRYIMAAASAVAILTYALAVLASTVWSEWSGDVMIIGEYHDNPVHHAQQQNAVNEIRPAAVVYEMLTPEEAAALADVPRDPDAMRQATQGFHWTNIADYADVLARSPVIIGAALPRTTMRAAFSDGAVAAFGADAAQYGLSASLPSEQQATREALQFDAHCAAMPREMMAGMVEAQRLRDARFSQVALDALAEFGAPVVVIVGSGHVRQDWGIPAVLARAAPEVRVFALAFGEGAGGGTYDAEVVTPAPARGDPCEVFRR